MSKLISKKEAEFISSELAAYHKLADMCMILDPDNPRFYSFKDSLDEMEKSLNIIAKRGSDMEKLFDIKEFMDFMPVVRHEMQARKDAGKFL